MTCDAFHPRIINGVDNELGIGRQQTEHGKNI